MSFNFADPDDVLLSIDDICKKLGISRSTLDRLRSPLGSINSPTSAQSRMLGKIFGNDLVELINFPPPTVTLGRSPRWSSKVLNSWLESQT